MTSIPARIAFLALSALLVGACTHEAAADGPAVDPVHVGSSAARAGESQESPLLDRTIRISPGKGFTVEGSGVSQLYSLGASRKVGALARFSSFGYQELAKVRLVPDGSPAQVLQEIAAQMGQSLGVEFGRAVDTNHPQLLLLNHPDGVLTLALLPGEEPGLYSVRATYAVHQRP